MKWGKRGDGEQDSCLVTLFGGAVNVHLQAQQARTGAPMTCTETADRGLHPHLGESQAWAPAQTSWRSNPPATLTAQPHCPNPPFLQLLGSCGTLRCKERHCTL